MIHPSHYDLPWPKWATKNYHDRAGEHWAAHCLWCDTDLYLYARTPPAIADRMSHHDYERHPAAVAINCIGEDT